MVSQIDPTVPVFATPTTGSVRANFLTAANEITALQGLTNAAPFLPLAGGRLQGPLYLFNDPTDAMMPATKGYVDASGGGGGGGGIPEAPADGSYYGRYEGSWQPVLPIAGGSLTGPLTLAADPTAALGAATKQYVDTLQAAIIPEPPTGSGIYGRGSDTWTPVLPIAGGQLSGSVGAGLAIPTAPAPVAPSLLAQASVSGSDLNLNAYRSGPSAWNYLTTGPAARFALDSTFGRLLIGVAASGNAGASVSYTTNALTLDSKGNVVLMNAGLIPTDGTTPTLSASLITSPYWSANAYLAGSTWKTLAAGYSQLSYFDSTGQWNLALYPSTALGGVISTPTAQVFLNQQGVFSVSGNVSSSGNILATRQSGGNGGFFGSYLAGYNSLGIWNNQGLLTLGQADGNGSVTASFMTMTSTEANVLRSMIFVSSNGGDSCFPTYDNTISMGYGGHAWKQMYSYIVTQVSDPRKKRDIAVAPAGALAQVNAIPVQNFRWKTERSDAPLHIGWLATDVRSVLGRNSATVTDQNDTLGLNLLEMIAILWQAVQELSAKVQPA